MTGAGPAGGHGSAETRRCCSRFWRTRESRGRNCVPCVQRAWVVRRAQARTLGMALGGEEAGEVGSRPLSLQSGTTLLPQALTKQLHSRTCASFLAWFPEGQGDPKLYCFILIAKVISVLVNSLNTEIIQMRK